jgi:eukaryotic-like serine/threonine-protein kinase
MKRARIEYFMDQRRWQRLEQLYHAALAREPDLRVAFLADACPSDPELRREVESLLLTQSNQGPLGRPVGELVEADLGPYRLLGVIGAGGMGTVYKAMDTRLGRLVAIKISRAQFTGRFEREAQAVAALNHPHVCTLYDVGPNYLVMEYVDGQPLKGPLVVEEALRLTIQIADALDAAHRKGIVHRDLKPANILMTKSGIKLLDFGLAKREQKAIAQAADAGSCFTGEGVIVGTLQYISPEQLHGKEADALSDIFSFGLVIHEMLTGHVAFEAQSQAGLVAAILEREAPSVAAIGSVALDCIVQRCLAKDPEDRWQTVRDLKFAIENLASSEAAGEPHPRKRHPLYRAGWWVAAGLAALSVALMWYRQTPRTDSAIRYSVPLPANTQYAQYSYPVLSPDGERIAVQLAPAGGEARIWIYEIATAEFRLVPGTEGPSGLNWLTWSPDSTSVVYQVGRSDYKRLDVSTGSITEFAGSFAGPLAITPAGNILVSAKTGMEVLATTGEKRTVAAAALDLPVLPPALTPFSDPVFLPDFKHFLYSSRPAHNKAFEISTGSTDGSPAARLVVAADSSALYGSGYLLYLKGDALLAQPFNPKQVRSTGPARLLVDGVVHRRDFQWGGFSVAGSRVLAFRPGSATVATRLIWLDRSGRELERVGEVAEYSSPTLSPDGKRLAVAIGNPMSGMRAIWLFDLSRGGSSRLTSGVSDDSDPAWSPDGSRIAFTSNRSGTPDLYARSTSGLGEDEVLLASETDKRVQDWSPDGRLLLFRLSEHNGDIYTLPLAGGQRRPSVFLATPFREDQPRFSPDGRWIAYRCGGQGHGEICAQPFPATGLKYQISNAGGEEPHWRGDGKELFYLMGDSVMTVDVHAKGTTLELGVPRKLFDAHTTDGSRPPRNRLAIAKDGKRFLAVQPETGGLDGHFTVILNWPRLLGKP